MVEKSQYLGFMTVVTTLLLSQIDTLGQCPNSQYDNDSTAIFNIFMYVWTESLIWFALVTSISSSFINVYSGKEPKIIVPTVCTISAVISYWINWYVLTIVDYIYNVQCLEHLPSKSLNRQLYVAQAVVQFPLLIITIVYLIIEGFYLKKFLKEKQIEKEQEKQTKVIKDKQHYKKTSRMKHR